MAVYKTDSGRWQAVVSYRDDFGKPKKKKKTFDLKREALNFETEFLKSLNELVNEFISFDEVFNEYIKHAEINSNKNTIAERKRITNNFLNDLFGLKMAKISKKMYLDVFHQIATSDYSHSYKNKIITQMKSIAEYAYTYHDIPDNTKTLPQLKRPLDEDEVIQVWTPEEFATFYDHVENEVLAIFYHTLFYTGLRRGEALALTKDDVVDKSLIINKSIKHFKNGFLPLKTSSSKREILLDEVTLNMIELLIETQDGDFLFGGLEPFGISTVQREFTQAKKRAGVSDIRLHDLRHSHASYLINKGANIVAVSRRLGHSNVSTTLEVYTHLMPDEQSKLVDLINEKGLQKDYNFKAIDNDSGVKPTV